MTVSSRPVAANRERLLSGKPVRDPDAMQLPSSTETPPKRGLIVVVLSSSGVLARLAPPHEADTGEAEAEQPEGRGFRNGRGCGYIQYRLFAVQRAEAAEV